MDFVRQDIHMCTRVGEKCSELTIDEDFNIPDAKGDMEKIIARQGRTVVEEVTTEDGRVKITGTLYFQLVYLLTGENQEVEFFSSSIPFEDNVSLDCISRKDKPEVKTVLEDLSVEMINSRKLSVRALVQNCVNVYEPKDVEAISGLENSKGVECLCDNISVTERPVCCQDVVHIKEELEIPQNKPNIDEILWSDVALRNMDFRAIDDGIRISGTVEIFAIYKGEEDHLPIQYVYVARSISEDISCPGVSEDMICDIKCTLGKGDVSIRQDEDGEDRVIGIDYLANVYIKMYVEHTCEVLKDAYSPQANIEPVCEDIAVDNLIIHNRAKTTVTNRRRVDASAGKLMQICHIYGDALVDDYWFEDTLHISGIVKICVLYVAAGNEPISALQAVVPYEYEIDLPEVQGCKLAKGENSSNGGLAIVCDNTVIDNIQIMPSINELSANMINSEEVDIKSEINLDIVAFSRTNKSIITDIKVSPVDNDKKGAAPGVVGYVASEGDTLWSIARRYYATTDSIRELNDLQSDEIHPGDRLLIMKS